MIRLAASRRRYAALPLDVRWWLCPTVRAIRASAEVEKNAEVTRQSPAEAEEKTQEIEYDEFLDDRFQATDN